MAKDSYWFRHDSTSGRDLKMRKIQHIYSHWGKGIYWDVMEVLREQDGYKYECDESSLQTLCDIIGCKDEIKFMNWFNDCVKELLFTKDSNYFFSKTLIDNMTKWEISKNNGSGGGRPPKPKGNLRHIPVNNQTDNLNNNQTPNPTDNQNETIIVEDSIEEERIGQQQNLKIYFSFFREKGRFESDEHLERSVTRFIEKCRPKPNKDWQTKANEWLENEKYTVVEEPVKRRMEEIK